jgi:hypothetical protein
MGDTVADEVLFGEKVSLSGDRSVLLTWFIM